MNHVGKKKVRQLAIKALIRKIADAERHGTTAWFDEIGFLTGTLGLDVERAHDLVGELLDTGCIRRDPSGGYALAKCTPDGRGPTRKRGWQPGAPAVGATEFWLLDANGFIGPFRNRTLAVHEGKGIAKRTSFAPELFEGWSDEKNIVTRGRIDERGRFSANLGRAPSQQWIARPSKATSPPRRSR